MRLRYRFLCVSLGLGLPLAAQAQQPFEKLGVTVKILSLSNGRYPEYFSNDSLRRIGTVVYNTRLKKVAYLLLGDSLVGRVRSEVTSRWLTVDPLAEKFAHISPYVYVSNNPLRFNDPDGRAEKDVILGGNKRQEAQQQLQASVQGSLILATDQSGRLSYTPVAGATQSKGAQELAAAIDDHSVTVNVVATDNKQTSRGGANPAGSFMGNTVSKSADGTNKVETLQELYVPGLQAMDAYYNKPGATTLHEVVESYLGGQKSQQSGVASRIDGVIPNNYQMAHWGAPPQSGPIGQRLFDQNNQPYTGAPGQTLKKFDYIVQEGNKPPAVIYTYP